MCVNLKSGQIANGNLLKVTTGGLSKTSRRISNQNN
jgi:hypothetical protein